MPGTTDRLIKMYGITYYTHKCINSIYVVIFALTTRKDILEICLKPASPSWFVSSNLNPCGAAKVVLQCIVY